MNIIAVDDERLALDNAVALLKKQRLTRKLMDS